MRLIGFDFTKVLAEKSEKFAGNYTTNTDLGLVDIKEEDFNLIEKQKALKVSFKFGVVYAPKDAKDEKTKFGEIVLEGDLVFSADEKECNEILQSWQKKSEKAMPQEFKVPLFNLIMRKCTPRAIDLEDSLGLPFHFPFPQIKAQSAKEDKK
jgi:hypothetical protein